jgi:hypothetical protein
MQTYERPTLVRIGSFKRKTGILIVPPPDALTNMSLL